MRKIIYTVSVGGGACFHHCVESQKRYAQRVGADFFVRSTWQNWSGDLQTDSEKRFVCELLKHYDKVLYLDADVFIREDADDIFHYYKDDPNLVIYNEVLHNNVNMDVHIEALIDKYRLNAWGKTAGHYDWLNAGVMLLTHGQDHESAFYYTPDEFFKFEGMPMIYDMPFMNYQIFQRYIPVTHMEEQFNCMVYFHDNGDFLHFANVLDRDERILQYV